MKATPFFVGLVSGAASAALSVALLSGSMLSLLLSLFAPLPIFIAALGWRHYAGLVGAITGTALLYALDAGIAGGYAASVGLPAWWLAYVALLGQSVDPEKPTPEGGMIWYPIGRIVAWAAVIGSVLVVSTLALYGGSVEDYRAALRAMFGAFFKAAAATGPNTALPTGTDAARLTEIAVMVLPPVLAATWTVLILVNLWAAGRIVRASGRLVRPWPNLSSFHLPSFSLIVLLGGIAGSAMPGRFGFSAGVVGAAFAMAFALLGLALLHTGTRGTAGRGLMLSTTYVLVIVQTWLVLILTALGVVEFLFGIRARIAEAQRQKPPKPSN